MSRFERHVFVCTNQRAPDNPKGDCTRKGGPEVRERFKEAIARHGLRDRMRASASGCLDACETGCTVVVYPEAVWYAGVTPGDVDEIVETHLIGGEPVVRLLRPDAKKK